MPQPPKTISPEGRKAFEETLHAIDHLRDSLADLAALPAPDRAAIRATCPKFLALLGATEADFRQGRIRDQILRSLNDAADQILGSHRRVQHGEDIPARAGAECKTSNASLVRNGDVRLIRSTRVGAVDKVHLKASDPKYTGANALVSGLFDPECERLLALRAAPKGLAAWTARHIPPAAARLEAKNRGFKRNARDDEPMRLEDVVGLDGAAVIHVGQEAMIAAGRRFRVDPRDGRRPAEDGRPRALAHGARTGPGRDPGRPGKVRDGRRGGDGSRPPRPVREDDR